MKSHTRHLTFNVPARMDFVNITQDVVRELAASGIQEGLCLVNAMHITASVFINDDEPGLHADYKRWLEKLAPFDASPGVTPWASISCAAAAPTSSRTAAAVAFPSRILPVTSVMADRLPRSAGRGTTQAQSLAAVTHAPPREPWPARGNGARRPCPGAGSSGRCPWA